MPKCTESYAIGLLLLTAGCTADETLDVVPRTGAGATAGLDERFAELHGTYLDASDEYLPLLRATLRHARRLVPTECLGAQSQLVEYGGQHGYDGLEPLWLIYQDCLSTASPLLVGLGRAQNFADFQSSLQFSLADPHPQMFPRISHYNTRIDRGVRGDAVRAVLEGHAAMGPEGSWVSLHGLLRAPTIVSELCALPTRLDEYGNVADAELLRHASCAVGVATSIQDACTQLFGAQATGQGVPGLSAADNARLEAMCDRMGTAGGASPSGIDTLDGFSTDWCLGESGGRVSVGEIPGLILDCYFAEEGTNPVADGGVTSANFDTFINQVVVWQRDDGHQVASFTYDDPSTPLSPDGFRMKEGETAADAWSKLHAELIDDPPAGIETQTLEDGSFYGEGNFTTESGAQVSVATLRGPEGQTNTNTTVTNDDGSGYQVMGQRGPNGSSSTTTKWDKEGRVTSTTTTTTDSEGNTTTTTTTYEYDEEGNVKNTKTSTATTTPGEPGAFDPHNPACQELMALGLGFGSRSEMFDELYERGTGPRPEEVYPSPEDDTGWEDAPGCGASGLGGNGQRGHCSSLVMCTEGSVLNDECQCEPTEAGAVPPARGCIEVMCPEGTMPVPVGGFGCTCETGEEGEPELPPGPGPMALSEITEEFIWNRPEGEIVVTPEMQQDFADGAEPPF